MMPRAGNVLEIVEFLVDVDNFLLLDMQLLSVGWRLHPGFLPD